MTAPVLAGSLVITVHGRPAPQGSKRAFAVRGKGGVPTGRIAVIESSHDRVKSWRQAVIDAAAEASGWGERPPLTGPLEVSMVFAMPRPKGHYRTGRNAHLLRDSAPARPAGTPDLSKLCRATEDALTDIGVWTDDAQVVEYVRLAKVYAPAGALTTPGALITITSSEETGHGCDHR
jgi:Holliday junction resolvase RusA-like endonuclease